MKMETNQHALAAGTGLRRFRCRGGLAGAAAMLKVRTGVSFRAVRRFLLPVLASACCVLAADAEDRHAAVRALDPAGYWPLDEGSGAVLYDRSGNGNHGLARHVAWRHGLLDFTSAYQHAEIPANPRYQSEALTIGGWVFSRRDAYGGSGFHLIGSRTGRSGGPAPLCIRVVGALGVNVVSSDEDDVVGSLAGEVSIAGRQWQHVLYSYEGGEGKLYVNGELAASSEAVLYDGIDALLLIGWDADGWGGSPPVSHSLDGSVREVVLFDRALPATAVAQLCQSTRPAAAPKLLSADEMLLDGRMIPLSELAALRRDERRRAYGELSRREHQKLAEHAATLMPGLESGLDDEIERLAAIGLLRRLDTSEATDALARAVPRWLTTLQDETASTSDRATGARALLAMGAIDAVPALTAVLDDLLADEEAHLPRVEDLLRNAVMEALLRLGREDEKARAALGRALARPVLDVLDLSRAAYAEAAALADEGRNMEALAVARRTMTRDGVRFLTQNDPRRDAREGVHPRSYTCAMEHGGYTYTCGNGVAYDACEAVPTGDFAVAVEALSARYPEVAAWREPGYQPLCRARITRTDTAGHAESIVLEGEHFIFDAADEKNRSWSIAADRDGYLHLMGGQHNVPYPNQYLPGIWEEMGLSRNRDDPNFPRIMYWVSTRPGDIHSFAFAGWGNPRYAYDDLDEEIGAAAFRRGRPYGYDPPPFFNYINFVNDNEGALYVYGRILSEDIQSWGLYRYDTNDRRWSAIGGDPREMLDDAVVGNPGWGDYLEPPPHRFPENTYNVLGFSWQPGYYDYIRASGVRFDPGNRMHVQIGKRGIDAYGRYVYTRLFAYSDDDGETFHRADGSTVLLPLTNNPAPRHHADPQAGLNATWVNQWKGLIRECGFVSPD